LKRHWPSAIKTMGEGEETRGLQKDSPNEWEESLRKNQKGGDENRKKRGRGGGSQRGERKGLGSGFLRVRKGEKIGPGILRRTIKGGRLMKSPLRGAGQRGKRGLKVEGGGELPQMGGSYLKGDGRRTKGKGRKQKGEVRAEGVFKKKGRPLFGREGKRFGEKKGDLQWKEDYISGSGKEGDSKTK